MSDKDISSVGDVPPPGNSFSFHPIQGGTPVTRVSLSQPPPFAFMPSNSSLSSVLFVHSPFANKASAPAIFSEPVKTPSSPKVDAWDLGLWGFYAASLGGGIALVTLGKEKPLTSLGYGMIVMAGQGGLVETLERFLSDHPQKYRWVRFGIAMGTGFLMGVAWQFLYGGLNTSGTGSEGSDGRNPSRGFGP